MNRRGDYMEQLLLAFLGLPIFAIIIVIVAFFAAIALRAALGILTATLAGEKGYNRFGFFCYGFFYFPFAIGVVILAQPINKDASKTKQDDEEIAEYEKMYEAGTLTYTQLCQKKEEIERRKYYK